MSQSHHIIDRLNTVVRTVLRPVSAHPTFFVGVMLMACTIGTVGNYVGAHSNWFLNFLFNIFDAYLFSLLLLAIDRGLGRWPWVKRMAHGLLCAAIFWLLFSELFVVLFYHSLISVHVVQLVMETNSNESAEFICSALSSSACPMAIGLTVVVAVAAWLIARKLLPFVRTKGRLGLAYVAIVLILFSCVRQLPTYVGIARCFCAKDSSFCEKTVNELHIFTPAARLLSGVAFQLSASYELELLEKTVAQSEVTACSHRCPFIVLVIGELYNKHHAHLYNKDYLNTTPHLDSLERDSSVVKFTDVTCPYNMTTHIFKHLFSLYDYQSTEEDDNWTKHSLFPALFRKAGYNVYFLTNQFVPTSNDDWDAMGGTFLNRKALSDLQFTWRNSQRYDYDEQLLDELPEFNALTEKPTLLIIHLMGQHVGYAGRYPKEFNTFTAAMAKTRFGGESGRQTEAEYANATYYNDYVVNKIFTALKGTDAVAIYVSDHGEEVYDWRDTYERTQERPIPKEVMHYQYEVPMLFYFSDQFKANHADVVRRVQASRDLPAVNVNLSHSLLWLAGITTPEYCSRLDVLSSDYDKDRKRMIWDETPYEKQ